MNHTAVYMGVDVSKDFLDIAPADARSARIENTKPGIRRLIKRIQKMPEKVVVCCEASGGCEELLCEMLYAAGIAIARVNPRCVRDFARSRQILAKTDQIDAKVLALFAELNPLRFYQPPPQWQVELKALLSRRAVLVRTRAEEKVRVRTAEAKIEKPSINEHIAFLDRQIEKIDKRLKALYDETPGLHTSCGRLEKVVGIGRLSALTLNGMMTELGELTDKQAAALAGVAPYNCDSGMHRGKRHIHGGRPVIRSALYMCAVSAIRTNPILREFYARYVARGKPPKVALTAVMRKLICLANHLLADPDFQLS